MRAFFASTLNRLVFAYGLGLLLAFVAIGALSLLAFDQLVERDMRQTVATEHRGLRGVFDAGGDRALAATIDRLVQEDAHREAVYLFVDGRGAVRAGHMAGLPPSLLHRAGWARFPWNDEGDDALAFVEPLPGGGLLVTGHTTGEQQHLRELVQRLGLAILVLLAALSLLLAWLLRRAMTVSLRAPLDVVDRVAAGRLAERVPERHGDDAFARLDRTLNRMLDRIRSLVGGIQSSSDAIAHDLRTPLMRLKTRLELARQADASGDATAAIDAAMAEADQLVDTFNSLLRLARIEGGDAAPMARIALDRIVVDAVDMWQALADAKGQALHAEAETATVAGDSDLLFQLLSNLLDNAIKYAPRGSRIEVGLRQDASMAELTVSDAGPGIPVEERERVFDRFVRLEAHRGGAGSGLGLSVVRAIAVRHGAVVLLEDARPGLRVRLRVPLAH